MCVPTLRTVLLSRGGPTYLLRDEFTTDAAGPLTSPRTCEPGPGTQTITDTESKYSVSGGWLVCSGGKASPSFTDPLMVSATITRVAGRTVLMEVTPNSNTNLQNGGFGWSSHLYLCQDNSANVSLIFVTSAGSISGSATVTVARGSSNKFLSILRGTGAFLVRWDGTRWVLDWVDAAGTANQTTLQNSHSIPYSSDYVRVFDLPAPWATDYGIATTRLSGSVSAGTTFTHTANGIIEWTQTTIPSGSPYTGMTFRRQDSNNHWHLEVNNVSSGSIYLYEKVAGSYTLRASADGGVSAGHRIVIIFDGTTIRGYSNNVLKWTYASASNFQANTSGELVSVGPSGAVSDLIAWPRDVSSYIPGYV